MRILREALLPETCGPSLSDSSVLFVSIDFENDRSDKRAGRPIREIGVCTFDTRSLSKPETEPPAALSTQNYRWKDYPNQLSHHKFLFGETKKILPDEMPAFFDRTFRTADENGQLRRIILVGHAIGNEIDSMEAIGVDITKYPSIVGVLDTEIVSKPAVRASRKLLHHRRLESILESLEIPHHFLHVASNDAHSTLKLALMLGVRHLTAPNIDSFSKVRLATIKSIAQTSIQAEMSNFEKGNNERRRENRYLEWLDTAPSLYLDDQSIARTGSSNMGSSDQEDNYEEGHRRQEQNILRPRLDLSSIPASLRAEESIKLLQDILIPQHNGCSSTSEQTLDHGVVLVALYMEFCSGKTQARGREAHQINSVGICSLDTRIIDRPIAEPESALFTESLLRDKGGANVASQRFLFGESKRFMRKFFLQDLQHHISRYGTSRRIILIGHNIPKELCAIRNMGIDFQAEFLSVIGIIDTKTIAHAQIPPRAAEGTDLYKVWNLFHEYRIADPPRTYLDTAGNLAHFILKLLLTQAIRAFRCSDADTETASTSARIATLEAIAQSPIKAEMLRETPDYLTFWKMRAEKREAEIQQRKERKASVLAQRGNDWFDSLEGGLNMGLELELDGESVR
jgi:hypothetical protein